MFSSIIKLENEVRVTYQFFHWKKVTPFADDQGIYNRLTWWEQIDNSKQLTRNRKFLTVVPVVLLVGPAWAILLDKTMKDDVVKIKRIGDRIIMLKSVLGNKFIYVISAYAPQIGLDAETKVKFWKNMDDLVCRIGNEDNIFIGGHFNGHVGKDRKNFERIHGGFGFGARNEEGKSILEFARTKINHLPRTRWWHLKGIKQLTFKEKLLEEATLSYIGDANTMWDAMASCIRKVAKEVLGESRGKGPLRKETWWWSEEVQKAIRTKRDLYRDLSKRKDVETFNKYKEAKKEAKRAVGKARSTYLDEVYRKFRTREGKKDIHKLAKIRERTCQDLNQVRSQGEPNVMYARAIKVSEIKTALQKMKNGKACGPDDIPIEVWMVLGDAGIVWLTKLFNEILKKKHMPNERVIERRLRATTTISGNQFGFMPGKSTTKAIFLLRMLIERYREAKTDLHMVFMDLEKAYDRVPREVLWWVLEMRGVHVRYIKVIKDMYDGVVTSVRTAGGYTAEFPILIGLHQGSTLRPYLFTVVMDELIREIQDRIWSGVPKHVAVEKQYLYT
ncbi:uncharacterized protein LOC112090299 [Morus notabilis]|uniref:uncharacterized protein LOC112090299 n=1 Tax=Morus notabilis TaxID=981085 RepID=UPI000CED4CB6|nr:uncharacterized protein LOC112090299 [Morus notabilis]